MLHIKKYTQAYVAWERQCRELAYKYCT